jgi:hypothetical protein
MPISSNRYVDITSGVGGAAAVDTRELKLRLYTTNELVPTGGIVNFRNANAVLDYFGDSAGEEYKQALYYFGFVSKVITQPQNIQFARWADSDTSAQIFGSKVAALDTLKTYTTAALAVIIGGVSTAVPALDFSAAASYAAVATIIQTAMTTAAGPLASATVSYNASRTAFEFDSNIAADGTLDITSGTAGLLADLGWGSQAIISDGATEQSVTDVVSGSTQVNNNYGSFSFIDELTQVQVEEAANWNNSRNVEFQFHQRVGSENAQAYFDALKGFAGTGVTLYDSANGDHPWLLPCAILASQQWAKPAASANYNYQRDGRLVPTVSTDALADTYDAIRVNYYGVTQEAGTLLDFYQRGQLMGGQNAPTAMGVYANEQWFKADIKASFLNMFLAFNQVPADETGQAIGYSYIDAAIARGKFNGVIATGKQLTTTQIGFITQITADDNAWRDVSSKGWWRVVTIAQETDTGGVTTYYLDYTLVYAKRDSVDRVQGRHVLI